MLVIEGISNFIDDDFEEREALDKKFEYYSTFGTNKK